MRLIIHAGPPKTGTTAIQVVLARNRAALLEQGIYIPEFPRGNSHRLFSSLVSDAPRVRRSGYANPNGRSSNRSVTGIRAAALKGLIKAAATSRTIKPEATLLSAEHFFRFKEVESLRRFSRLLRLFGPEQPEFRLYVRDPAEWTASKYLQGLKRGVSTNLRLDPVGDLRQFCDAHLALYGNLPTVRSFSRVNLVQGDIAKDFLLTTFPVMSDDRVTWLGGASNVSISPEAGLLLANLRKQLGPNVSASSRPHSIMKPAFKLRAFEAQFPRKSKPVLQDEIRNHILTASEQSVLWCSETFGFDFSSSLGFVRTKDSAQFLADFQKLDPSERVRRIFQIDNAYLTELRSHLAEQGLAQQ